MGQAVLEQRHLVSDLLAVSRFDHAWVSVTDLMSLKAHLQWCLAMHDAASIKQKYFVFKNQLYTTLAVV
jgi:hypothetical protein